MSRDIINAKAPVLKIEVDFPKHLGISSNTTTLPTRSASILFPRDTMHCSISSFKRQAKARTSARQFGTDPACYVYGGMLRTDVFQVRHVPP